MEILTAPSDIQRTFCTRRMDVISFSRLHDDYRCFTARRQVHNAKKIYSLINHPQPLNCKLQICRLESVVSIQKSYRIVRRLFKTFFFLFFSPVHDHRHNIGRCANEEPNKTPLPSFGSSKAQDILPDARIKLVHFVSVELNIHALVSSDDVILLSMLLRFTITLFIRPCKSVLPVLMFIETYPSS